MAAPVKARDVRSLIKEQGFNTGVVTVLERMCDEHVGMRETNRMMAEMLMKCVDNVDKMVNFGDSIKAQLEEAKRRDEQYRAVDHIPPSNG